MDVVSNHDQGGHTKSLVAEHTKWFWLISIVVTLVGTTLTGVGLLLQKRSHLLHTPEAAPRHGTPRSSGSCSSKPCDRPPERAYWTQREWLLGTALWLFGNVVCWVASGLAPQSLLSCLDCWNIVVALIVGQLCFGEMVTRRMIISGALLVVGCATVIAVGPKDYHRITVNVILEACRSVKTLCIVVATTGFLAAMGLLALKRGTKRTPLLTCLEFTAVSATLAWYTSTLSRSLSALLVTSVERGRAEFYSWLFWAFLGAFISCSTFQIHFLNLGLKYGDAVIVLPCFMAMSMTGQIIVGGLFFSEFVGLGAVEHCCFWVGVGFVLLGVWDFAMEDAKRGRAVENAEEACLDDSDERRSIAHGQPSKDLGYSSATRL